MLLRRISLAGDYTDTDWTDPANSPPTIGVAKATATKMTFALVGKASASDDAAVVDVGALLVDSYLATELGSGAIVRGKSIVEVEGVPISGRILLVATDVVIGLQVRLHLTLTNVAALPALDVELLDGGRVL